MMAVLLGTGIGLLLAGLAAIGYAIPFKEFSFGNTLILSGVVGACSGLIMLGLWVVARELQNVARHLGAGIAVAPRTGSTLEAAVPPAAPHGEPGDFQFTRDQPPMERGAPDSAPPPWPTEAPIPDAPPAEPAAKPKRNLLFSSSSRKERERAASRSSEPLAPDLLSPDLRPPPSAAPPPPPPAPEPVGPPPATFEDAWPKAERTRPSEAPPPRRSRTPPADNVAPPPAPREPAPQVTVLKSGVVDGMAYSLYSDGSIEAQMPEGMMRFASIDELRAHLDQRP